MPRLRIKQYEILRKALEDEVKKREIEELIERINKLKPVLVKISVNDVVKSLREDRDNR